MEAREKHPFKDARVMLLREIPGKTLRCAEYKSFVFAGWTWPQNSMLGHVRNLSVGNHLTTIGLDGIE